MSSVAQSNAFTDGPAGEGGAPNGTPAEPRANGRECVILAVLLIGGFTLAADFFILNVALPDIDADIGCSIGGLQWIATAFSLCAAGFTLLFGRGADLFGRRRLFLAGIAVLGTSSLAGLPGLAVAAHRRPRGPGPGDHACRAVAADHVVPRGARAGEGLRPERRAVGGRVHDRRDPRRRPRRPADPALGVLHEVALADLPLPVFEDVRHTGDGRYEGPMGHAGTLLDATSGATDLVIASPLYWYAVSTVHQTLSGPLVRVATGGRAGFQGTDGRPHPVWGDTTLTDHDPSGAGPLIGTLDKVARYMKMGLVQEAAVQGVAAAAAGQGRRGWPDGR
jgi:Major Facilitator Superfamily